MGRIWVEVTPSPSIYHRPTSSEKNFIFIIPLILDTVKGQFETGFNRNVLVETG